MAIEQFLEGDVLLLVVSNPPVNALSQAERRGLIEGLLSAETLGVGAVVIAGANGSFIAGADIREFGKAPEPPYLPDLVNAIESCPRPVIAAIAGQALGGGLEIALGCHYRVANAGAKLGLPEVTLGLVPGAGGTQRLPRLIDPIIAATMISQGKPVTARSALASGLIDYMVDGDPVEAALVLAEDVKVGDLSSRRLSQRPIAGVCDSLAELRRLRAEMSKKARGAEAPLAALDLVEIAVTLPFEQGAIHERETFLALRAGEQAGALRHIFFAERAAAKPPTDASDVAVRPVNKVGIVGAGTMGTGIAMSFADAGMSVTLVEQGQEVLDKGLERIRSAYASSAQRGRIDGGTAEQRSALVGGVVDYGPLADCDLIIEAAFETIEVKREIFGRLDTVAKPGAILATNTSYLDVDMIAAATTRPADVVGLHYFSPANVMRLLEVVRGRETASDVIATALAVARRTGKTPVLSGVCHGFIGNRMLRAYVREAGLLLLEGASPEQVDKALVDFGMAMGPFTVADLAGIDIGYKARSAMAPGTFEPLATIVHDRLVEAGHLGQKSGSGFYIYERDTRAKKPSPIAMAFLAEARAATDVPLRSIDDEEIVDRCMFALANEGGFILAEGIAERPGDIDVVYVNGYGFPRHRGGPMHHAAQCGTATVRERMMCFAAGPNGRWWSPSPLFAR